MAKQKKTQKALKASVGYPLEALFTSDGYKLLWSTRIRMSAFEYRFFCEYLQNKYDALLYLGAVSGQKVSSFSPSVRFLHSLSVDFLRKAAGCETEKQLISAAEEKQNEILPKLMESGKFPPGSIEKIYTGLTEQIISGGTDIGRTVDTVFKRAVAAFSVAFSIEENRDDTKYPFRMLITCRYENRELPLREVAALLGGDKATIELLSGAVRQIAQSSELIKKIYNDGMVLDSYTFDEDEMYTFLKEMELYSRYGITCRVPNRWKKHRSSLSVNMSLGKRPASLGTDTILSFDINLAIDGEALTPEEIDALLANDETLFMFRGKWVELKRSEMRSCLAAYESLRERADSIPLAEAMRAFLSPEEILPDDDEYDIPSVTFDSGEWMNRLSDFDDSSLFDVTEPSDCFTAKLRPYQADGVRWLNLMRRMGLGACLSDDMGLGKTLQAIAVLEQMRHSAACRSLIVIPASLLQNWQDEIHRFAPHLKYRVLHSNFGNMQIKDDEDTDVFITTYAMLSRLPQLKKQLWDCVILDEAQAIKNPHTMQSRAAKSLSSKFRIAMTGTPIENSITDLWSIFDFLNPLLFHNSLELLASMADGDALSEKLKSFVRPFILRRLKTDKSIISDLPEKIEMKSYCTLTQRQAVLYKQITNMLSDELSYLQGMERRGLVLSGILRLKQICNHPDQYTGNGAYLQMESGKFIRLAEICEDIRARHERVLVFTQFKEMCEPLSNALRDIFGQEGLIIHGSTSISERGAIVDRFNDPNEYVPYIVLSLRAGGVGLNLTAANHVIHFDRWWNPAVENQATDRAFRIGQTGNVLVHKLICTGTLEEKIDKLIDQKSAMATDIVENDVKLTELSDEELLALLHMDEN